MRQKSQGAHHEQLDPFPTTDWTGMFTVRTGDDESRLSALKALLERYWTPVYSFLRCKGYTDEDAEDITQDFLCEVVLKRSLAEKARKSKGRFRTFLLTALTRYETSLRRAKGAKRRTAETRTIPLEFVNGQDVPGLAHHLTPSKAYDYAWACAVLDQVLGEVAAKCRETGNAVHWELFRARVLRPIMEGTEPPSLESLCSKHGLLSKAGASNMIITVKRCFKAKLKQHVRQLVDSDAEVDDEVRHLISLFSRG